MELPKNYNNFEIELLSLSTADGVFGFTTCLLLETTDCAGEIFDTDIGDLLLVPFSFPELIVDGMICFSCTLLVKPDDPVVF